MMKFVSINDLSGFSAGWEKNVSGIIWRRRTSRGICGTTANSPSPRKTLQRVGARGSGRLLMLRTYRGTGREGHRNFRAVRIFRESENLPKARRADQPRFAGQSFGTRLAPRFAMFGRANHFALTFFFKTRGVGASRFHRCVASIVSNRAGITALKELTTALGGHIVGHAGIESRAINRRFAILVHLGDDAAMSALGDDIGFDGRGCNLALRLKRWYRRRDRVTHRGRDVRHHPLKRIDKHCKRRGPVGGLEHRGTCAHRDHNA